MSIPAKYLNNAAGEDVVVSFSLFDDDCVDHYFLGNKICVVFGANYHVKTEETPLEYPIDKLGEVLSQPNRIKILNSLLREDKVTSQDLCQMLSIRATNTYYHISMMTKIHMLTTESAGRLFYYKLNKTYFDRIIIELKNTEVSLELFRTKTTYTNNCC